jgi:hypothetical protein
MEENWLAGRLFQQDVAPIEVPERSLRFDGSRCSHVRQLFKRHGLDHHNLRHWHVLIWELAGDPKRRPRDWDELKLYRLRFAVDSAQRSDPRKDDTAVCKELSKAWGTSWQVLRRRLQDARKPAHASAYQYFCEQIAAHRK